MNICWNWPDELKKKERRVVMVSIKGLVGYYLGRVSSFSAQF